MNHECGIYKATLGSPSIELFSYFLIACSIYSSLSDVIDKVMVMGSEPTRSEPRLF